MTTGDAIKLGAEFLQRHGVESPRLNAEHILAHIQKVPRLNLYMKWNEPLPEAEVEKARALMKRRSAREPLQHLLGTAAFCGNELEVSRDVLVPRPETELLAEMAWLELRGLQGSPTLLDFGTGSGCLAIAIATEAPLATIHALDISAAALELARRNAAKNQVQDRIVFHHSDGFQALPAELRFDVIVSNPPYIPTEEIAGLQPEVRDFDPHLALDGGADGLKFYRTLASEAGQRLLPGGVLLVEFGLGQEESLPALFENHNMVVEAVVPDYTRRARFLRIRLAESGTPPAQTVQS